ncbi:aquaporin [Sinomonas sp. JGH33]|uniref:Aquaporin n=1 Tax=Sinomonas terricola TaxID=3110330 RepID=A0ABU5T5K4_9MICC|nr:aquaporin [Sinomonas sp. JGH33]MEA5454812.1 aquaporin [Sinomonas sp. JGH33]
MSQLARRVAAEFAGTAFLVAAVVGSGIMASRLSPSDTGLALLENSIATGAALIALITALQPISASFNPVVTLVERFLGVLNSRTAAALIAAQFLGGLLGTVAANLMFGLDAVAISAHARTGPGLWLGEIVATAGLVLIVFGTLRTGRGERIAVAVGSYIAAAYWFTSSTSFANPAVTLARTITDTFAGIAPASAPAFVVAQLAGGTAAFILIRLMYPSVAPAALAADRKVH